MAKMYPTTLSKQTLENPKLSSEVHVFEKIRDKVPGDYTCYYSRSWHEADDGGAEFDGEADFILAHAEFGLLFLEVKGGRVSCREADGQWLSMDRDGFTFKIKNPLAQALRSKYHFLKRLTANKRLGNRFIRVRHGAVLPGSARPIRALAPDVPLEIVAFGDDMDELDRWIVRRMTDGSDAREQPLGSEGLKAVEELLIGHFELRAHIGSSLADDAKIIERLTGEQAWILDSLEDNRELAISGGAGTGKTILAIEMAIRSADEGSRTLLTCFNSPLAGYLQEVCKNHKNLEVASFHSLCASFAKLAEIELPKNTGQAFFDKHLPGALVDAVCADPNLAFDSIVVDEGQDFQDSWLHTLRLALKESDKGRLYVFYDDNQRLFSSDRGFIDALPSSTIALTRNLRNTQRIHEVMAKWYEGRRSIAIGPEGEPIGTIECRTSDQALTRVTERIAQMLRSGQVTPGQIAVLTGSKIDGIVMPDKIAGVNTCASDSMREGSIVFDTVRRFKGLSRPCVFIVGLEGLIEPELIYVAASRANLLLELVGTPGDIIRITRSVNAPVG